MIMAAKKKGLGKGLDALLSDAFSSAKKQQTTGSNAGQNEGHLNQQLQTIDDIQRSYSESKGKQEKADTGRVLQVPVEHCQRGRYQPRRAMDCLLYTSPSPRDTA
mgnify:CR=1 FL=1